MSEAGQLLEVGTDAEAARARPVRRGVHVRALVGDIASAVAKYRKGSHASKRAASARAVEIAKAVGEASR